MAAGAGGIPDHGGTGAAAEAFHLRAGKRAVYPGRRQSGDHRARRGADRSDAAAHPGRPAVGPAAAPSRYRARRIQSGGRQRQLDGYARPAAAVVQIDRRRRPRCVPLPGLLQRADRRLASDGGRVQAQTDAAAAQRDEAVYAYENTVRAAFAETENGLNAIFRLREQAVQNDARRATAAETLRIAHNRYSNGYASYLDELDAQRTLYSADVGRLQLRARMLIAAVDLYRAMGGGWSALDDGASSAATQNGTPAR